MRDTSAVSRAQQTTALQRAHEESRKFNKSWGWISGTHTRLRPLSMRKDRGSLA